VLENLPDGKLMQTLEEERANGRDYYPVRPLWNSLLAMVVCEHKSVSFGFEKHTICGQDKMTIRLSIGLAFILSIVLGRARELGNLCEKRICSR